MHQHAGFRPPNTNRTPSINYLTLSTQLFNAYAHHVQVNVYTLFHLNLESGSLKHLPNQLYSLGSAQSFGRLELHIELYVKFNSLWALFWLA